MSVDNKNGRLQNELPRRRRGRQGKAGGPKHALSEAEGTPSASRAGSRQGKGGGPKTKAGKARSSRNAATHYITSNDPVIPEIEDPDEYRDHVQGFIEYFQPQGAVEEFLVERYASLLWRTRRVTRHEVHATMRNILAVADHMLLAENYLSGTDEIIDPDPEEVAARQHNTVLPDSRQLESIQRHEGHLGRQVNHTLRQLLVLQARRTGAAPYYGQISFRGPPAA